MSVRPILTWPAQVLATVCAPAAGLAGLDALVQDLLDTMYAAPGRGLAAPQIGVARRVFVMDAGWKEGAPTPRVCIDPRITWVSRERVAGPEGCLSIPGIAPEVSRAARIVLTWTDLAGVAHRERLTGAEAVIAQHEYDHLDGLVHFDRISPAARDALVLCYEAVRCNTAPS